MPGWRAYTRARMRAHTIGAAARKRVQALTKDRIPPKREQPEPMTRGEYGHLSLFSPRNRGQAPGTLCRAVLLRFVVFHFLLPFFLFVFAFGYLFFPNARYSLQVSHQPREILSLCARHADDLLSYMSVRSF